MRYLSLVAALLMAGSVHAAETAPREMPPSVLFARLAPSVVVIDVTTKNGTAQGSGVSVGPGLVVTNYHVIEGNLTVKVRQGTRAYDATVQAFDPKRDLAILNVPGFTAPRVPLRPSAQVKVGDRAFAIGAPRGLELSLSDGLISALRPEKRDGKETGASLLQTTAPVSPGSSGGGLFDLQGRLVGITTFSANGQNLNFAHPTEWIVALLGGPARAGKATGAIAAKPAGPRLTISERPEALRCTLRTTTTWGLFSAGPEILETRSVNGTWDFDGVATQLPLALAVAPYTFRDEPLVLSDMNRQTSYVRFSPQDDQLKAEYFFFVDDDGAFQMAVMQPVDFHGQVRAQVTFGMCEALTSQVLQARRQAPPMNPYVGH